MKSKIASNPLKSVSWAPVEHIKVIGDPEKLSEDQSIIESEVEKFVKKLRSSPKHTDTIYVYQSDPMADFDDLDEFDISPSLRDRRL